MKYYAVKKGRQSGIFETWKECEALVKGFSGAVYKSFATREDAEEYMNIVVGDNVSVNFTEEEQANMIANEKTITAFVDGSYEDSIKQYAFGLVALGLGKIHTDSCADFEPIYIEMRNVAGELVAAMEAMNYCIENNISNLDLYYDYEGIEKWATGAWKCNKEGTKQYKLFCDSIKDTLNVSFHKVPAHTGIKYNEMADKLAKSALGL